MPSSANKARESELAVPKVRRTEQSSARKRPKATQQRRSYRRSSAWLRRARAHFANLHRPWVERTRSIESYRGRLYLVAEAMCRHRLLASKKAGRDAMFAVLSQWRRADRRPWWPWRASDKRRWEAIDWGIRLSTIKMDAEKERKRA